MKIDKDVLSPYLIYNRPIKYNEYITLYPVTMDHIIEFQVLSKAIIVRKDSIFREKKIIKMTYLDFLLYCFDNTDLEVKYKIKDLSKYYIYVIQLLQLCCHDKNITITENTGEIIINGATLTPQMFDDLRRIIIIQNDIDFDIDEFLNYDTEQRLLKAQKSINKKSDKVGIEDQIDSLAIAMNTTEEHIMKMTIRKFYRYLKRCQLHENYTIAKTGECSGMISFKEPIKHWMASLEEDDKYEHLKTNENSLKGKINDANG